ncbi:MAG TPA: biopolymer transporter ExbD [Planctomycetaceae bacterium]|nr:biopolymer transporter ExbD [Planctomycetaceae bacterium]
MSHSSEGAEPNLTPILDMVFQLITFFMLVINFKGAAMDMSLKLPVLGSARPLEYVGRNEPLMLNIDTAGKVQSLGQFVEVEPYVAREARILKLQLDASGTKLENDELPVPVIIRADKSVDFSTLNRIIRLCQAQGYRQFALSAMTKAEGAK